jgi:hypothetical protein
MNGFIKESFHPTVGAERRKLARGIWGGNEVRGKLLPGTA